MAVIQLKNLDIVVRLKVSYIDRAILQKIVKRLWRGQSVRHGNIAHQLNIL
jgi:hypothetical protein